MKNLLLVLMALAGLLCPGQSIHVTSATVSGLADAIANDHLVPLPVDLTIFDQQACSHGGFTPGLFGNDYASICFVHAKEEGTVPQPHEVSAYIGSRALINGDNSPVVHIRWKNTGSNYATSDGHNASIVSSLDFTVLMEVTGIAPGTPVTVYWWFSIFAGGTTEHEDPNVPEDSISVINAMAVNGDAQVSNQFNFSSPGGLPGWNEWKNVTGTFTTLAGTDFSFSVASMVRLYLNEPAGPGGMGFGIDQNHGIFKGDIWFTAIPEYPVPVNNIEDMLPLFSLDIGSDAEFSDPQQNGNEYFDPGDLYAKNPHNFQSPVPPFRDDAAIFGGGDPDPKNSPPINPAPVGSGASFDGVRGIFFDLDGADLLEINLDGILPVPGEASLPWFADSCIFESEYLFVSFDDDDAALYTAGMPGSVPVNSFSPFMGTIYSGLGVRDEIMEFDFDVFPVSGSSFQDTVDSESELHINLAPDPPTLNEPDDDVDALDMIPIVNNVTPCSYWYFSCDHEAVYNHPSIPGFTLDPAVIYLQTPAGPVPVVTHLHHNLQPGTDIDAFEFAWVRDAGESRFGLALLFSVDDDDPLTIFDESGGLDPRKLYYSFMNGAYYPFSAHALHDDIDALAAWSHSLNGAVAFPNPVWGTKTWRGSHSANWNHHLNWFPRGVPFDPEDVLVPPVSPMPVIGTSGLDCRSLEIGPGAQVNLMPGVNFEIKGN